MKAPSNAAAPPAIHAPIISSRVDVQEATIAGVTKIPEPTIPPITTMVESKKPMRRASRSSGTLYHARARLAGQPGTPSRVILFMPDIRNSPSTSTELSDDTRERPNHSDTSQRPDRFI